MLSQKQSLPLALTALGIVYGDIGTSPLYALRESLRGLPISTINVLGILSLIFWSLILVISIRYLMIILRADNNGEGGILALLSLLRKQSSSKYYFLVMLLAILGTGLLLGDGMLTPAISVISAVEGLEVIAKPLSAYILPISIIILLLLFLAQHVGSEKIGHLFSPILLVWFITIAILGGMQIWHKPIVIYAINPYFAVEFFYHNGWQAYPLLGGVFLVMTGGEALYADLGHFDKRSIRLSWFSIVLPALVLNYFGQGANLLQSPQNIINPFYTLAPSWGKFPLLILATIATIIASQAIISASFSLAKQAVLLHLCPRLTIIQTSPNEKGQVYAPLVNVILAIGTLLLIISFKTSSALAGAYGIAINLAMFFVTILTILVAYEYWQWSIQKIALIFGFFIAIDISFLGANCLKLAAGGWVPIVIALFFAIIMFTWHKGMQYLRWHYYPSKQPLIDFIKKIPVSWPQKHVFTDLIEENSLEISKHKTIDQPHPLAFHGIAPSTAIFIADQYDPNGGCFLHYLELNGIMHKLALIISIEVENNPYIPDTIHASLRQHTTSIYHLSLKYGFKQTINLPRTLEICNQSRLFPFHLDLENGVYFVEMISITTSKKKISGINSWQKKLFAFLLHNSQLSIKFYQLPHDRAITIGSYCKL